MSLPLELFAHHIIQHLDAQDAINLAIAHRSTDLAIIAACKAGTIPESDEDYAQRVEHREELKKRTGRTIDLVRDINIKSEEVSHIQIIYMGICIEMGVYPGVPFDGIVPASNEMIIWAKNEILKIKPAFKMTEAANIRHQKEISNNIWCFTRKLPSGEFANRCISKLSFDRVKCVRNRGLA